MLQEIISEIAAKIKEKYLPEKIILFGSLAYGNPTKESDIDLLIIKNTKDKFTDRVVVVYKSVEDIREINLSPFVITPEELKQQLEKNNPFFMEILAKGKVL